MVNLRHNRSRCISHDEEREFWATHDSADYLNWDKAERVIFPKLKPSTKTISLRMSDINAERIALAGKQTGCILSIVDQGLFARTN